MEYITRTLSGAKLQTALYLDIPYTLDTNSTLNEKYNTNVITSFNSNEKPKLYCFGIGYGGHKCFTGPNGVDTTLPVQHKPTDASLYKPLPLILREVNNDISSIERAKYRLRVLLTINGVSYVAYFLKVIDFTNTNLTLQKISIVNNVITETPFGYDLSNLNPTPPAIQPDLNAVYTTGNYAKVSALASIGLSPAEVTELLNSATIILGSDAYAIISEICLVQGADRSVTGNFNGSSASYIDIVGAQIASFINTYHNVKFSNNGAILDVDVGAVEPLLDLI